MTQRPVLAVLAAMVASTLCLAAPAAAAPRSTSEARVGIAPESAAVVRLINRSQRAEPDAPWQTRPVSKSSGTGFVIDGGRILTNAHVVADTRLLQIYLYGDPTPYEARVVAVAHDADVAVVEPLDPSLLAGITPLPLGDLPGIGSTVTTLGYPAGGRRLSSTQGVVSRIEVQPYSHSRAWQHLSVQTDAAINPGNSGGPVVQDGKVVGIAFQGSRALDNVGFFIPPEIVKHVLTDLEDGSYEGWPYLGAVASNLENPAARRRLGMTDGQSGVHISHILPHGSAAGVLQVDDVLMAVDGFQVANDATIERFGLRLGLTAVLDRRQNGEPMQVTVLRDGEVLTLDMPLRADPIRDAMAPQYDALPRYVVYAGLVFVPLNRSGIEAAGKLSTALRFETGLRRFVDPDWDKEESVMLLRRLDHPVNSQLAWYSKLVVEEINGVPVKKLDDVIAAFEEATGDQHVLSFGYYGRLGVLDRAAADAAHEEILQRYGVPEDRRL